MNASTVHIHGLTPYADAHRLQRAMLTARIDDRIPDTILCVEHTSTVTIGRARGAEQSILSTTDQVFRIERGGDATWHGPGQLTVYPIIHLDGARADLHAYLSDLEQAVINLLAHAGLNPTRDSRNTGVWLPSRHNGLPQKVCSIGIACRKWVTWHGIALNICPTLVGFDSIQPCGMEQGVVTRLCDHLDNCPDVPAWRTPLCEALHAQLGLTEGLLHHFATVHECSESLQLTLPNSPPLGLS